MTFNVAVFYDIENLMGGYKKAEMLRNLSLTKIHNNITEYTTGDISLQRAYANWSDHRLNLLRQDIIKLGIDPIQMFGFGSGPEKNASDIQLVIDAMEIAFTRQHIDTFVIVSGDGGFSSLAKKLHEYGKTIIGCGYRRITNHVFEAVSDQFIWLEEPQNQPLNIQRPPPIYQSNTPASFNTHRIHLSDPVLISYAQRYSSIKKPTSEDIFTCAQETIDYFLETQSTYTLMHETGLNISVFSQAMKHRVGDIAYNELGFGRQVEFISQVVKETPCKLIHKAPSEYLLTLRECHIHGFHEPDYGNATTLTYTAKAHSTDYYKELLSQGIPLFRIPLPSLMDSILEHILANSSHYQSVTTTQINQQLTTAFNSVKNIIYPYVYTMISAGLLQTDDPSMRLSSNRTLSFVARTKTDAINHLKQAMLDKLSKHLTGIDEKILETLITAETSTQASEKASDEADSEEETEDTSLINAM